MQKSVCVGVYVYMCVCVCVCFFFFFFFLFFSNINFSQVLPFLFEVELAIEKLKNHKSLGIDQIPAELIKAGGRTICCKIHKLIISIWNKEEFSDE